MYDTARSKTYRLLNLEAEQKAEIEPLVPGNGDNDEDENDDEEGGGDEENDDDEEEEEEGGEDEEDDGGGDEAKKSSIDVWYGTGHISAHLGVDTVTVAGLTIPNQVVADATSLSTDFVASPFDGIFGLGLAELSSSPPYMPPFYSMINHSLLDAPVFAFYTTADAGEIDFGGIDASRYTGDLMYAPAIDDKYWMVQMDSFRFGELQFGPRRAIVDSGKLQLQKK